VFLPCACCWLQAALRRALHQPVSNACERLLGEAGVAFSETAVAAAMWTGGDALEGPSSSGAGRQGVEEVELAAVRQALAKQFRVAKRFAENARLRLERARVVEQLKQFQVHLHQQQQAHHEPQAQRRKADIMKHPTRGVLSESSASKVSNRQ